jgi:hypothetical protein
MRHSGFQIAALKIKDLLLWLEERREPFTGSGHIGSAERKR